MEKETEHFIEQIAEDYRGFAAQMLEAHGTVEPVALLLAKKHGEEEFEILVVPGGAFFDGNEGKDTYVKIISQLASEKLAFAIIFISEVWMSTRPKEMPLEDVMNVTPSEDPERVEAIMMTIDTVEGSKMWEAKINRRSDAPFAEAWTSIPYTGITGRFVDILKKVADKEVAQS